MVDFPPIHRSLLFGITAAAIVTAFYFLWYCTNWPWVFSLPTDQMFGQIIGLLFFMACVCIPYAGLVGVLNLFEKSPVIQVLSFTLVIGLAVYYYGSVRLGNANSGGWEFAMVPLMQLAVEFVLVVSWKAQEVLLGRKDKTTLR